MSLPHASQQQIDAMNAAAEKKFGSQAPVEAPMTMHPTLQHHEEPTYEAPEEETWSEEGC